MDKAIEPGALCMFTSPPSHHMPLICGCYPFIANKNNSIVSMCFFVLFVVAGNPLHQTVKLSARHKDTQL